VIREEAQLSTLRGILQGKTAEEVEERCLAAVGSELCRDIAELRAEIARAIERNRPDMTYIVHGDYAVVVYRDYDEVRISKKRLDEAIKEYWPFSSQDEVPHIFGADYWVCCGRELVVEDGRTFEEALAQLKQEFERRADSAVHRAAAEAVEEKLKEFAEYERQLFASTMERYAKHIAWLLEEWARHAAGVGRMENFLRQLRGMAPVFAGLGVGVEDALQSLPSAWPRAIIARKESLESVLGRGRVEDAVQRCLSAFGSAACGRLAAAREDVIKALKAQKGDREVHYVVSGEFAFEVRDLPGGWALIRVHDLVGEIKTYMPLGDEEPPQVHGVWYWYLPGGKVVKADDPASYVNSLIELRRWLTEGPADLRAPPPEVRRAALSALGEVFKYASERLGARLGAGPKVSV